MALTAVPPLEYQDCPVDVQIRVFGSNRWYTAEVHYEGGAYRFPIHLTREDVAALNRDLHAELQRIALMLADGRPVDVVPLADVGNYLFRRVFPNYVVREWLMGLSSERCIEITSDDFFAPWELMYPTNPSDAPSFERFWGMNHVISRVIPQELGPGAFVPSTIECERQPILGLLTDSSLPSVTSAEVPYFEELDRNGKIVLRQLNPLDAAQKPRGMQTCKEFLMNRLNIAHFACEAEYDQDAPHRSSVTVSDEFKISLQDMDINDFAFRDSPLVTLNACTTGVVNPLYTSCFAGDLLKRGARAIVATECLAPDEFATEFAKALYENLLGGDQLGSSILNARQQFLRENQDPTGLLYAVYGPPTVRLSRFSE